jgi:hypothetical protein
MFVAEKYKSIFHDTESLAKGLWSAPPDDMTREAGYRRYGGGKLCLVMTM